METCDHDTSCQFGERLLVHVEELCVNRWRNCVQCCCSHSSTRRDMCRDSSLCWTCVCVGVFFANSSAKLNIPQPGGHLTTCSSSIEHVTVLCGFTLTPSSGIRQDCLFEYAQFARPLGMGELYGKASSRASSSVLVPTGLTLESPKQKSSAPLPNLSKDQAGRVAWQVLTRGTPLNHSCGRVAKLALERRRVQQRCPRGFSSAALGHRPQNRQSQR